MHVNDALVGVVGIDLYTEEILAPAVQFNPNKFSYSFIIEGGGKLFALNNNNFRVCFHKSLGNVTLLKSI